ncbi:helix-turn-helix transcriptional regulator [Streptomyces antimicrobicus]|uniref:Helix-turn-helix transcriptional regulator n=1 Tax=Streptomyces antimicrobicus TaxID=2883108 RepID=A0ABS8B2L0_9ACTN|nr:helix-turn-helix transcriptional regulator [Streptomyces antimicrobicus]MCB5178827.1 helix-turn-helix transcriptional regulator [Streptomyces antimicrobicus]
MTTSAPASPGSPRSDARRHELAEFLRSRRERITPEQVGLVRGPRRRTPGLRREEVAQLSSVGVTWYTWLEQARDIQVSVQVLDAVARALLLDASERAHLFALAGSLDPAPPSTCPTVTPSLRAMIDQLGPVPACVQNSRYDILAYNAAYGRLFGDLDATPAEDRNCMWLAFTDPQWRAAVVDLPGTHRTMAAKFRAAMAEHLAEPAWKTLLARLEGASEEFREVWARHEVIGQGAKSKYIRNPYVGLLHVEHTNLWLGPAQGARLVAYVPLDEETRERLERLRDLASDGTAATTG